MRSFLSERQWRWVEARLREGYRIKDLADFLGMHRDTVRRGVIRFQLREAQSELPPLSERRREFLALGLGFQPASDTPEEKK